MRSHLRPALAVVLATFTLAACGSSGPAATTPTTHSAHVTAPTTESTGAGSDSGVERSGASSTGGFTSLDMSVRVVNVYAPHGSKQGKAIDVWAGYGTQPGSKKLATVAYGQVSSYFAPAVYGSAQGANTSYTLSFFAAGTTPTNDNALGNQSETSAPGQKLTIEVEPGDSSETGAVSVFLDQVGSSASASGFTAPPRPPAGKALLELGAQGLALTDNQSLELATASGSCPPYLDPTTGKVHTQSDTTDLVGGTESLDYVLDPGMSAAVILVKDGDDPNGICGSRPLSPAFDPKLASGGRAYAFVYGTSASTAKVLLVPVS